MFSKGLNLNNIFFSAILIGSCLFFFSCDSEPLVGLNNLNGFELKRSDFQLHQSLSNTVQGANQLSDSPRLYAGILDHGDTATAFIRIRSEIISLHQACNADSISEFNLVINTLTDLMSEDSSTFYVSKELISITPVFGISLLDESIQSIISQNNNESFIAELIDFTTNKIIIDLFNYNDSIMNNICGEDGSLGLIISYLPIEENVEKFIEFRSSDVSVNNLRPMLSMEYFMNELDTFSTNSYSIEEVQWLESSDFPEQDNMQGPLVINDMEEYQWGMIYAFDVNTNQIETPINYENIQINSDLLSILNTPLEFLQIDLLLNQTIISELDSIQFSLINAVAFVSNGDPMGDNWSEIDTVGTEGNGELNWIDGNNNGKWDDGEGEQWFDHGEDACPDSLETGLLDLCEDLSSIYNSEGTEGNGELDWIDENNNGKWDDGEGEQWWDQGIDGCSDLFESGDMENPCLENENLLLEGIDSNGDNYLIDPNGDDWSEDNPNRTEGNGIYNAGDPGEPGEPYFDWGSDGLPFSLSGFLDSDDTEDNGIYDLGEPFDDTGSDGLFNLSEPKYNPYGTEGNQIFDGLKEFDDCGEDNNCSDSDISDDYVIDPNGDNWNEVDGTEGDGIFNDGENFYDWGLDGVQDTLEVFQVTQVIYPGLGENTYQYTMENNLSFSKPSMDDNVITIWIAEIIRDADKISLKFGIETKIALKGLQFQLHHIPFTLSEVKPEPYEDLISSHENENLFEDITYSDYNNFDGDDLEINFSNNLSAHLYFNDLGSVLNDKEINLSQDFSHLILHIDQENSEINEQGMFLHLGYNDEFDEYISLNAYYVTSIIDSMIIPIGNILRGFQNGNYGSFNNLIIKTDGELYNYSKLIIMNNSGEIENDTNPIMKIMYWQ